MVKINTGNNYMAVSHNDWELPNSRIWLAEIDIDCSLDFPIQTRIQFAVSKLKYKTVHHFLLICSQSLMEEAKKPDDKKK